MKIGILIDRLNVGGVEKVAIEQVKNLRSIGDDARLVVLCKEAVVKGAFNDLLKDIPVEYLDERLPKIFRFSFRFPIFSFFSLFHITYPFLLSFFIKTKEYDYLIAHGTYTSFSAVAFKYLRGISFSAFIWDPIAYILGRVYSKKFQSLVFKMLNTCAVFFDRMIINASDVILVGGKAHNSYFKRLNSQKKIITIYPSVYPALSIRKKKKPYALMVTAWKRGKNPEYVFTLLKHVGSLKIVMVGKWIDPNFKQDFLKKISDEKLNTRIKVVGEVNEKLLKKYYQDALFLIQTNDDRGFGMPALEAAGNGTTFIIPKGQGVCEIFTNGVEGFYTNEHDTKVIIKHIKTLINNPKVAEDMGRKGWMKVVSACSWENHAKRLKSIMRS